MEGTAGVKTCSGAVSTVVMIRLMVGWETLKFSARVSSAWLCRRYNNRVAFWALVLGLFQVRLVVSMFRMVVNRAESSPVVR